MPKPSIFAADDAFLPDGWKFGDYGDTVICPTHQAEIELDGECPDGCESPVPSLI